MTREDISKLSDEDLVKLYQEASENVSAKNTAQMSVKILSGDF